MKTAIVGAGLAGLAAAVELEARGEDFVLLEGADRVGGVVGTLSMDGYLLETGPRTVPSSAPTLRRLVDAAGLSEALLSASPAASRRYIWSGDRLHVAPMSPGALLGSSLLSWSGRLRVLRDLFLPSGGTSEETVAEFVTRRFGAEANRRLADPLCAGVFGASPEKLGVDAFARLSVIEAEHGSILRGLARMAKERKRAGHPPHTLVSFEGGLQQLTDRLGTRFAPQTQLNSEVRSLADIDAEQVIIATSSSAAAALLEDSCPEAAALLSSIRRAPMAVVALGFSQDAVEHRLDGFGLLCCSDSPLPAADPVLGVLFSSSIFPGRAPNGRVLLEVMIGGARCPEALASSDDELTERARAACEIALGARGTPEFSHVTRWAPVLPQYERSHAVRVDRLRSILSEQGRVVLAGNYLEGVGVESAALSGVVAAQSFR